MIRPLDLTLRFHKMAPDKTILDKIDVTGLLVTSQSLTRSDIAKLRAYMATKPVLIDGQTVEIPRS